jgi:hypothetical protein
MGFTIKQMLEKATEFVPFDDLFICIKQKSLNSTQCWVVETEIGERITAGLDEIPNDPSIKFANRNITFFKSIEQAFAVADAYRTKKLEG